MAYALLTRATYVVLEPDEHGVDLSTSIPGDWDKVCIFEPYSTSATAKEILDVYLNLELRSDIGSSDSIALFITMKSNKVKDLFDVSRKNIDFTQLGGQCFDRNNTKFTVQKKGHHFAEHT
jgi:hypothetical protein